MGDFAPGMGAKDTIGGRDLFVLVAEDDDNDILLLGRVFQKFGISRFHFVHDGQEAIDYLQARGKYSDRSKFPFPNLLITDLKMPRLGGLEVLNWVREHNHFSVIPTIVFSASGQDSDVKTAYELGANTYIQKPSSLEELQRMVTLVLEYWAMSVIPQIPKDC
jgi:CheY-like chemotaxis protein